MKKKVNSLYIHIPFCRKICAYCDFFKLLKSTNFEDNYINELVFDLKEVKNKFLLFKTIYIGGGTPSCLELNNLEKLLQILSTMHLKKYEFTIECNPEDITEDFLKLITKYGVNRISLGIQTFKNETIKKLNRTENLDYFKIIEQVKKYITNINVDFIYGLPDENIEDIKNSLDNFLKLKINHISLYSLTVNKNTLFYNQNIHEISEDKSRDYYDYIVKTLTKNNFIHYEVSNFAKSGYKSLHNLTCWNDENYVGVGVGAHGYINNIRYKISLNITSYLNHKREISKEIITEKMHKEEFIMLALRLKNGIDLNKYHDVFNENFLEKYAVLIKELIDQKLIIIKNNHLKCTKKGFIIQDLIIVKFFDYI